ncbi:MAG: hypothetical protein F6K24_04890 [Okeania sp. SIO2D1]|nr:hypothetical protein [Okeania sp. SIO2D1]
MAAGLAVSVCGATVRPKRGSTLEAGALLAQLLCKRQQKDLRARWLGIPRCHASAASGGCQERISNVRQDFLHKLSRKIVNDNQVVIVENLNIKGLVS